MVAARRYEYCASVDQAAAGQGRPVVAKDKVVVFGHEAEVPVSADLRVGFLSHFKLGRKRKKVKKNIGGINSECAIALFVVIAYAVQVSLSE